MPTFTVIRDSIVSDGPTMGKLYAGTLVFDTLERPWLGNANDVSCIPTGTYVVKSQVSSRFGREMPTLCDVLGRSHILIHALNRMDETHGCIGIGSARAETDPPTLKFGARFAFEKFCMWLKGQNAPWTVEVSYRPEDIPNKFQTS